jgi:signal peptidase I
MPTPPGLAARRSHGAAAAAGLLTAAAALTLVMAGLVLLGGFGTLVTHGGSMAPRLRPGDLVVVHRQPAYRVGDVVAYRSRSLGISVLHRIVDIDGGRFVTRGDSNDWLDPDRPSAAEMTGRLVLRVPKLGAAVQALHSPTVLAAAAVLLVLAATAGRTARHRRRRRQMPTDQQHKGHRPVSRPPGHNAGQGPGRPPRPRAHAGARGPWLAAAALLATAGLGIAALWLAPGPRQDAAGDQDTGRLALSYQATTPAGAAYPTGQVSTGEPIFLRLVHALALSTTYTGRSSAPVALSIQLEHPSGWRRTAPLDGAASAYTTGGSIARGTLDLDQLASVLSGFTAESGLPAIGTMVVAVSTVDGWTTRSTFTFDGVQLQPDAATLTASQPAAGAAGAGAPTGFRAVLAPLGRLLPGWPARTAATLALLAAAATATVLLHRRTGWDPLRSSRVFRVADHSPAAGRTLVDLQEPGNLARVADLDDLPIFESDAGHYFVDDGAVIYRYRRQAQPGTADMGVFADQLAAEVVSRIARDFRTPLATIRGYAELLGDTTDRAGGHPGQRKMLAAIDRGVSQLHHMIDDVTQLAELDQSSTGDSPTELIDVPTLLTEATAPLASALHDRGVRLTVTVERNLPRVAGHARTLAWAVGEVVRTAAVDLGPGGLLELCAGTAGRQIVLTMTGQHGPAGQRGRGHGAGAGQDGWDIALPVAGAVIGRLGGTVAHAGSTTTVALPVV